MRLRPEKRPFIVTAFVAGVSLYAIAVSVTTVAASTERMLEGERLLQSGKSLLVSNPAEARHSFAEASAVLEDAVAILSDAPWYTQLLTPLPPFRWQVGMIRASHALAESGRTAAELSQTFPALDVSNPDVSTVLGSVSTSTLRWYTGETARFDYLEKEVASAYQELNGIPDWVAYGHSEEVHALKSQVAAIHTRLPQIRKLVDNFRRVSGLNDAKPHHYLVLFQNDAELRPSGGFIGSYAVITASGGTIRSFAFGTNVYKLDKAFVPTMHLDAPEPPLTADWAFRDSNRGFGFLPELAPQVKNLYEKETKTGIEGIVFLDSSLLTDMLRITGPLTLPGTTETADADTISDKLTNQIEREYFTTPENIAANEPKSILGDLIPVLMQHLASKDGVMTPLATALGKAVERKSLQAWSADTALNQDFLNLFPTDSAPLSGNWLKVVNNNIGGLKSSTRVAERVEIEQRLNILRSRVEQTVTVVRTHTGMGVWPDGENKNYMEIYIPQEAEILQLPVMKGGVYDLSEELQRQLGVLNRSWNTVVETEASQDKQLKDDSIPHLRWKRVGFWATTSVGEETRFVLKYALPLTLSNQNRLTYLKQAGSAHETLSVWGKERAVEGNLFLSK